jgi:RND family efflux transporter MFP subunit
MLRLPQLARTFSTVVVLLLIIGSIYALWVRYQIEPLTRDGKVRADLVPVAPDVSGLVTKVLVRDNEPVKKWQVLLQIDPSRYKIALAQADADVESKQAELAEAIREDQRNRSMSDVIATESVQQSSTRVQMLRAALARARAARELAALNLERTQVRAQVDGVMTNVGLLPGTYLTTGAGGMALVDDKSLRVEGYFEETKLPAIHVGDPASVYLMGVSNEIRGHVQSIAGGIADREREGSNAQYANVNPSFTWVRLAQRIPVRIAIDSVPSGVRLVPGQTATVVIHPRPGEVNVRRSLPW